MVRDAIDRFDNEDLGVQGAHDSTIGVDVNHIAAYEANLGIILDKWSYEGALGSRTRLVDWLKYGLAAVVTVTAVWPL